MCSSFFFRREKFCQRSIGRNITRGVHVSMGETADGLCNCDFFFANHGGRQLLQPVEVLSFGVFLGLIGGRFHYWRCVIFLCLCVAFVCSQWHFFFSYSLQVLRVIELGKKKKGGMKWSMKLWCLILASRTRKIHTYIFYNFLYML